MVSFIDVARILFLVNSMWSLKSVHRNVGAILRRPGPFGPHNWQFELLLALNQCFDMRDTILHVILIGILHVLNDDELVSLLLLDLVARPDHYNVIGGWICLWKRTKNLTVIGPSFEIGHEFTSMCIHVLLVRIEQVSASWDVIVRGSDGSASMLFV